MSAKKPEDLELAWEQELILGKETIFNCGEQRDARPRIRFTYRCGQTWTKLTPTKDPKVRICETCNETVKRCKTVEEAESEAKRGACIAVAAKLVRKATNDAHRYVIGRPDARKTWAGKLFK